jgi:hypothetical protein
MKQIIGLLVIALTSISADCMSVDLRKSQDNTIDFAKRASRSENWKQLFSNAGTSIPPYFKDELLKAIDGNGFPSISIHNSTITFRNESGNRVTVEFRDHGKVFLNDRAFEIRPLDSLASELDRVETKYSHPFTTKTVFDFLLPSAYGGSPDRGVLLASYIVASGWTSSQCGSSDLTEAQKHNCPITAAAMVVSNQSADKFFPVELSCPATEPNGTLELISKNISGTTNRLRVTYSNYTPKFVEAAVAFPGKDLHKIFRIDLDAQNDQMDQDWASALATKSNAIKTNVCEGTPQNRQRYFSALSKNKSILINAARDQALDEDSGSGSSQQAL